MKQQHAKVFRVAFPLAPGEVHDFFFPYEGILTAKRYVEFAQKLIDVPGVREAFTGDPPLSAENLAVFIKGRGFKETGFESSTCETDASWVKYATDSSGGFQPKELVHVL